MKFLLIFMLIHLSLQESSIFDTVFDVDLMNNINEKINEISNIDFSDDEEEKKSCIMNPSSLFCEKKEIDFNFNMRQMVLFRGFLYEEHNVITQDCYNLTLQRIINPNFKGKKLPPVLLQHGFLDSAYCFVYGSLGGDINDSNDKNLAFALAKRGYDVWLGNFRGNTFSTRHTTLNEKDPLFWRFSFDNHALQDLPAELAYIQKNTGYDQVGYVGFSQGTMTMFELLALRPNLAKVVKPYIALAPVAYLKKTKTVFKYLAYKILLKSLVNVNSPILHESRLSKTFSKTACVGFPRLICQGILNFFAGFGGSTVNKTRIPVYFNHLPAGSTLTNLVHYGQNINSGKIQMFDYYKSNQNKYCYGSINPPEIKLDKIINENIYLLSAVNDIFADFEDVQNLYKSLKVKFEKKVVETKHFSHVDFVLSDTADIHVNNYVIDVLKNNKPNEKVADEEKLILENYNEKTCTSLKKGDLCNLDYKKLVLDEN